MMDLLGLLTDLFSREEPELSYECCSCGERFGVQYHCCPECEAYSIERVVWQTARD